MPSRDADCASLARAGRAQARGKAVNGFNRQVGRLSGLPAPEGAGAAEGRGASPAPGLAAARSLGVGWRGREGP